MCESARQPRRCRWFGHQWILDESKTCPGPIKTPRANHYEFCQRCNSRRVMHVMGFGYQPYDEDWLLEALKGKGKEG
jgi:hypothetical protein